MGRRRKPPRPEKPIVVHYEDDRGKRCRKGDPGAVARKTTSESYFTRLPDPATGKRRWYPLKTDDLGKAWAVLRDLLAAHERERAGILDPALGQAARPLSEHIAEWIDQLRAGGKTGEDQLATLHARVVKLAGTAGWVRLPDVTRDSTIKALAKLRSERTANMPARYKGRSVQTSNHYLRAIKQLCTWLVEEGRLDRSPVAGVDMLSVRTDRRHDRRVPADDEVIRLMAYLEGALAPEQESVPLVPRRRCGMSGADRALGYRVCMATGLRADELRSLERTSFDLVAGSVTCRTAHTKNRRLATMPLPDWLVEELRAHFAAGGLCWHRFPDSHPGRLLKADLAAAGVAYETQGPDGPLYFDFHALRVWYITFAANQPGISPKTLQTMARHSSADLTLNTYAKSQESDVRRQTDQLPRPGGDRPK